MVVRIAGKRMYLWRAVDHEGEVLDMLVQSGRDSRAALRLMRKPLQQEIKRPDAQADDAKAEGGLRSTNMLGWMCL